MKPDRLMQHISYIDDSLVQQAGDIPSYKKRYGKCRFNRIVLVAAIAVLMMSSFAVGALAATSGALVSIMDNKDLQILQDYELGLEIREIIVSSHNVQDSIVSVRFNTLKDEDDVTMRPKASISLHLNDNIEKISDSEAEDIFQLVISLIPEISRANIYLVDNKLNSYYGDVSGINFGFSNDELDAAMNLVKSNFINDDTWNNCDMWDLWYDEEQYKNALKTYMTQGGGSVNGVLPENVIILFSDIYVGTSGVHQTFEPGDMYLYNWCWILIRDNKNDPWRIDDMGVI